MADEVKEHLERLCPSWFTPGILNQRFGPTICGGFAYAFNRAVFFRAPSNAADSPDVAWVAKATVPWSEFESGEWLKLPTRGEWRLNYVKCPSGCNRPFQDEDGSWLSEDCDICDGDGVVMAGDLLIGGLWFSTKWIQAMWEVFGESAECRVIGDTLAVRGDGGFQGFVMRVSNDAAEFEQMNGRGRNPETVAAQQ